MPNDETTIREFGERLKQARVSQSRSLGDLSSLTKIHRRHLEAIESGDISHLPQGPYIKAFLQEYARALGVSVPPSLGFSAPLEHAPQIVTPAQDAPRSGEHSARPKEHSPRPHEHPESGLPIGAVAKETARFANTAVKSAVKSVTRTTESIVDMVETGGKEALEAITSKSLWEEAEGVRRERLGLPPKKVEVVNEAEGKPGISSAEINARTTDQRTSAEAAATPAEVSETDDSQLDEYGYERRRVSSKGATNVVIALLLLLFGAAAFFAIRMYKREGASPTFSSKDYVPAPVENAPPLTTAKRVTPAVSPAAPAAIAVAPGDSLKFTLRATQPVWVSIAPDGLPAYRGELKAGEVKSYRASQKFVINIGNQRSVEMQFNGQRLSNLPAIQNSGVVVRDLVLMRDHVTLGGAPVDVNKLTTTPPVPVANTPPPVISKPATVALKPGSVASMPANHSIVSKSTASKTNIAVKHTTVPNGQFQKSAVKSNGSKPNGATLNNKLDSNKTLSGKKQSRNSKIPGGEIHPVEPIPPGP
jgi:transcriptional regulator with XRE-family HTH domain